MINFTVEKTPQAESNPQMLKNQHNRAESSTTEFHALENFGLSNYLDLIVSLGI